MRQVWVWLVPVIGICIRYAAQVSEQLNWHCPGLASNRRSVWTENRENTGKWFTHMSGLQLTKMHSQNQVGKPGPGARSQLLQITFSPGQTKKTFIKYYLVLPPHTTIASRPLTIWYLCIQLNSKVTLTKRFIYGLFFMLFIANYAAY